MYGWLKFLHVLAAISAVGSNLTFFYWLHIARGDADHRSYVLRRLKGMDARLGNPPYLALPVLGVLLVLTSGIRFFDLWVWAAITLFIVTMVFAGMFFAPALGELTSLSEAKDTPPESLDRAARRTMLTGATTVVLVLIIVYLMVLKPTL